MGARAASTGDMTPRVPEDDGGSGHEDHRPDLGLFGRVVTVLIVVLLIAAAGVALFVDPVTWVLVAVMVGALVLWSRLVR